MKTKIKRSHSLINRLCISSPFLAFLVVINFAVAFFCVWQKVKVIRLGYDISAEKKVENRLQNKNRSLRLKLAERLKNKNLEVIGKKEFSLIEPKGDQIVFLLEEKSS